MLSQKLKENIKKDNELFEKEPFDSFGLPEYKPEKHYLDIASKNYFRALIVLRHYIKAGSDYYFSQKIGAKNVDLFMITPSVSSPSGAGSDSEVIPIKFGKLDSYLVDSSQFGFEPLLLNGFDKLYCYLPSMRGEDCDERHLNQFYHCEAEIKGNLENLFEIIESYVKTLSHTVLSMPEIYKRISLDQEKTKSFLKKIINKQNFERISFDYAVSLLEEQRDRKRIDYSKEGKNIKPEGERELFNLLDKTEPLWITGYDRDLVPFYQKPDPENTNKVINADLLFPPLLNNSFCGEIVGCGQRQDRVTEMYESLKRQEINPAPYEWYIDLRRQNSYKTTSGFGLGIERFISWCLGLENIRDLIIYPRLKNIETLP